MSQIGAGGIIERERCNVVGQCIKRFERVRGVADSFPLKKKKKNDLGGQRSKNEKCLYLSKEYVYKVSLSSDGPKPIIFLKKNKK